MKKSRYVASILRKAGLRKAGLRKAGLRKAGLRGAGIIILALPMAACDRNEQTVGEQDVKIYSTVEACQADADPPACEAAHNQAVTEHREKAPRYATSEQCKTENKDCEEVRTSSGGSFFMPAMMGFMMGRMMSGGGGYGFGSRPVYYDSQGYATTTDRRLGTPNAPVTGGVTSVRAPVTAGGDIGTRSATVSRGGFGASSSGYSSAS